MKEILENARKLMKGYCRVCPVCDGRACAGEVPGMGGLGTASAFKANLAALAAYRFNMRLVHDVKKPQIRTTILGKSLSLPVLAAPIGGVSFNMGGGVSEAAYIEALIQGSLAKAPSAVPATGFRNSSTRPASRPSRRRAAWASPLSNPGKTTNCLTTGAGPGNGGGHYRHGPRRRRPGHPA